MNSVTRYTTIGIMSILVLFPILVLFMYSFGVKMGYGDIVPDSFSLDTMMKLLDSPRFSRAFKNSLKLSLTVTFFTVVLGFGAAKTLGTIDFKGRRFLEVFVIVPALIPGIAIVLGLRNVMIDLNIEYTFLSLVLAELVFVLPYFMMFMIPVFRNYDLDYESQAATLGIGWIKRNLYVTVPQVKNGLVLATMYSFIVSWSIYLLVIYLGDASFPTMTRELFTIMSGSEGYDIGGMLSFFFILPALAVFLLSTIFMSDSEKAQNF